MKSPTFLKQFRKRDFTKNDFCGDFFNNVPKTENEYPYMASNFAHELATWSISFVMTVYTPTGRGQKSRSLGGFLNFTLPQLSLQRV